MKKVLPWLMGSAIFIVIFYMLGPKESVQNLSGTYPEVPTDLEQLEAYIQLGEDTVQGLKPNNEARIVWADPGQKKKTPYSMLYVHGFGASQMEGDPVHQQLAQYFGANLFLARLPEHGIERSNAFEYLDAKRLVEGARRAYMISRQLGDSVIVVGTSMGGALSLILAEERPEIHSLVLYSPCIAVYGDRLDPLFQPWMKQLMKMTMTNEDGVQVVQREAEEGKYWAKNYHINAYTSLAVLLKSKMNQETFEKVKQPLFMAYYYKNEEEQDKVVSVPALLDMYASVSTSEDKKRKVAFPEAGDHVIASSLKTESWDKVLQESIKFLEEVVHLSPVENIDLAEK
jgi:esterase/lipase